MPNKHLAIFLAGNDRLFPEADFQFVAIGIFKKAGVIAGAVAAAKLRAFQIFSAGLPHQFCNTIDFLSRIGPECDARSVRLMILVLGKSEELRRLVDTGRIKSMEISAGFRPRRSTP